MSYKHLSQDERYQIYELRLQNKTQTEIAKLLGRSKSCISREFILNTGPKGWRPGKAHQRALERQKNSRNARRINQSDWERVANYIQRDLSPQQAIARLTLEQGYKLRISHETVYLRIYATRKNGCSLIQHLRGQKLHRKRYNSGQQRRGSIKERVSIDERPSIVDQKQRIGDWEGDTVIGAQHQGVILTLADRHSRFYLATKCTSKHAKQITEGVDRVMTPYKDQCHTITFDNGKEFAGHKDISALLDADIYFAHPYSSWERGLNENFNGLLRQYFPKKTNLHKVTEEVLQIAVNKMNHRPRKCLGYRTPYEVFHNLDILPLNSYPCCTS